MLASFLALMRNSEIQFSNLTPQDKRNLFLGLEDQRQIRKEGKIAGFRIRLTDLGSDSGSAISNWLCDYELVTSPLCTFL